MGRNTTLYSGQSISERLATPRRKIEVCVEPGKPWQNAIAESFNGKFRDECLSLEWFHSAEAVSRRRHTRIGAPAIATGVEASTWLKVPAGASPPNANIRPSSTAAAMPLRAVGIGATVSSLTKASRRSIPSASFQKLRAVRQGDRRPEKLRGLHALKIGLRRRVMDGRGPSSKNKAVRNSLYRFPGILQQDRVSHDLTLHARGLILQLTS
jgi:hypothetical protein